MMAPTYEEIMNLSDEDLQKRYDAATKNTVVGTGYYWDEIVRRRAEKQAQRMFDVTEKMSSSSDRMLDITVEIRTATNIMMWAAIASVVVSIIALIIALQGGCH
jgi:hypothetical protein